MGLSIRNRIKELRYVPAGELRPSPQNWRTHPAAQADALRGVLAEVGVAGAALARELPDGSLELIDGHLRAETLPADHPAPVLVLDVTESEARLLLATFDPIGDLAAADTAKLDALLRDVQTGSEAVAGLLDQLLVKNGLLPEPEKLDGLPELGQTESHTLTLRYTPADEADIKAFVGCPADGPLDPGRTGKLILERIKTVVAAGADLE